MLNIDLLKYNIKPTDIITVGCSAGPDSMALLHYLSNNTKNKIICCHINHNVRKESIEEENFLKNYCNQNNIIFESITIKEYVKNNFENEAREKRYDFYEQILKKHNSNYLFLAHHGDDLIETVLMKISRGSSIEGYAGIKEISIKNNYYIIRPFIKYTKEDLINYNKNNNVTYYIDKSNENTKYTRNRYRKTILPLLKKENPNIHKQFLKYSNTILEYNEYIEKTLNKILPTVYKNNALNILEFNKQELFIKKYLLYKILKQLYNNTPNIIKEKNILDILNLIDNQKPNLTINLPNKIKIKKSYNNVYFYKDNSNNNNKNYKVLLNDINIIDNYHIIKKIDNTLDNGNDICKLNSNNIKLPLYLRNRKNGDYIYQLGLNGRKKIKEIFIENKVPLDLRDNYPILVDSNDEILWMPNIKKSKFNSKTDEFYDIILKYCEKEENNEQ